MSKSIKFRIVLAVIFVVLFSLLIIIYQGYRNMTSLVLEQEESRYALIARRVNSDLESIFTRTALALDGVAQNPAVQEAFAARDREQLTALTAPIYKEVQNKGIEQFQFHTAPAISFLRLHKPEKFGDDLSSFRNTVLQCNSSREKVQGLEEGRGGFGLRVVMPVFYQGDHVGSVEYGMGLNAQILTNWQEQTSGDYYIISKSESNVSWESNQDGIIASTTEEDPFAVDPQIIDNIIKTGELKTVYSHDKQKAAIIIPLKDYSGKAIGYVKVLNDRSEVFNKITNVMQESLAGAMLILVFILMMLLFIINKLFKPFNTFSSLIQKLGQGELDVVFDTKSQDEFAKLGKSLNHTTSNLRDFFRSVVGKMKTLAGSGQQLYQVTIDSSGGLQESAASATDLSQSAVSLEESTRTVHDQANEVMEAALSGTAVGQQAVSQMQNAEKDIKDLGLVVEELSKRSNNISNITELINNLAEQTNLLALNAAIEAARAGENGHGFAVVAQQVRKLAGESAAAAKQISGEIEDVQQRIAIVVQGVAQNIKDVNVGAALVGQSNEVFHEIMEYVKIINQEIDMVLQRISQISSTSQQVSAMVEEQTAMAEEVHSMAETLSGIVEETNEKLQWFKYDRSNAQ